MTERHPGGREPAPQENIFEEELKGFKRARLEGHISSEQLQRIKETLAAPDLKKLQNLRLTRDITSEDFIRLKNILGSKEPVETGGAGAAEAASRVPEPIVDEKEMRELRAIKGLDGQEPGAEAAAGEVATVLKETTRGWKDRMRAMGERAAARMPETKMSRKNVSEFLRQLGTKRFWGTTLFEAASGAGVGFLARNIANSIGILTGGAGYLVSVPAGAVAGALSGGVTTWLRERRREISKDEVVEKARSAEGGLKEKLDGYLKLVELEESRGLQEIGGEKEQLYQELRGEFGARRKQILIGATRGALMGALGGFVGTWLADHFFSGTGAGGKTAENLAAARKAAKAAGGEALRQQMEQAATEASGKTYEKAMRAGIASLDAKSFNVFINRGEGATHLARKLIHDYIVEQRALLGGKFSLLNKAELVYAEDYLRRVAFMGQSMEPNKMVGVAGGKISEAIANARALTEAEVANLNKNWVGKISKGTWKTILNYAEPNFQGNNFSKEILEEAKRRSGEAAKKAAEAIAQAAARPPSPQATEAAGSWLQASWLRWGVGGTLGAAAAGATIYKFYEPLKRAGKDAAVVGREFGKFAREMRPSLPSFKLPSFRRGGIPKPLETAEAATQEPGPVVDIEAQRRAEEETQRAEAARIEATRTEAERVEREKKLAADPIRKLLQEGGIIIVPEDRFRYEIPSKESIAKREGPSISFDNYPDFHQYWESLTPDEKAIAESFKTTIGQGEDAKKYPTLNLFAKKDLWDRIEANPELDKRFFELREKALKGLLADEYRGLPEKEDPQVAIELLVEELQAKFKNYPVFFFRRYDLEIPPEEEIEAFRTLSRVLGGIKTGDFTRYNYSFMIGKRGLRVSSVGDRILEIDPSLSENEMMDYILNMQPKLAELGRATSESWQLRYNIEKDYGITVRAADYGKDLSIEQEIIALGTLREALNGFPMETLKLPNSSTVFQIGPGGVARDVFTTVVISVRAGLSMEEIHANLLQAAETIKTI